MTDNAQSPVLKKKKNLSPVWILPVLAAVLALWLLVSFIQERGSDIMVRFPSATGIEANKTLVRYQGIIVGQVIKVSLAEDKTSVDVAIRMQNSVDDLLRQQTQFWLVSPKASLTGIDGLDALFSGNYIAMLPGQGDRRTKFVGTNEAPAVANHRDGLMVHINAPARSSLNIGSGLYFQQVKVGEVINFKLNSDGSGVEFEAFVEPEYQFLVRNDSRFWSVSGAQIDADRSGLEINIESLATLMAGGIAFSSPADSPQAQSDQQFTLYEDEQAATPRQRFTLTTHSAEGINQGSQIRYRGVTIGEVEGITLGSDDVTIDASVELKYQHLLTSGAQFSQVGASIGLDGVSNLDTIVFGDFIRLWPGDGRPQDQYPLLSEPPASAIKGHRFVLSQDKLHGVNIGAPIRFRGVAVGEVLDVALKPDQVDIEILIAPEHSQLVRQNSRFWLHGVAEVTADFASLSVKTAPLTDALHGGIAFSSSSNSPQAEDNSQFTLFDDRSQAMQPNPLTLQLTTDSLIGLNPGSPVFYRDLEIGNIKQLDIDNQQLKIDLTIKHQYRYLIGPSSRFWHYSGVEVEGSLAGINVRANPLISMIRGGLSLGHIDGQLSQGELADNYIYRSETEALHNTQTINLVLNGAARIDVGAPIRFEGHAVGEVTEVQLSDDLTKQTISAELDLPWAKHFIRQDSLYYLVQPQIGLSGVRNVQAILSGNHIAVLPGNSDAEQTQFVIATEEPLQLPFDQGLRLVLNQSRLGSLHIGSPVLYRQVRVGEVIHTRLANGSNSVDIEIQLEPRYQHLVNASSRFWNASGVDIDFGVFTGADIKTESLETILAGGIAFATEQSTSDANRLEDGQRMKLYPEVKPGWLEWSPQL